MAIASYVDVATASHTFERGGDGGRRHAEIFREAGADGSFTFLDGFPDGF